MVDEEVERWIQQARKGSAKLAVLHLMVERDRYGYELIAEIKARTRGRLVLAEGNLYPLLHALEKEGHIASYWQTVEPGIPARKYYRLTAHGRQLHARMADAWREFDEAMGWLLEGSTRHAADE